MLWWRSVGNTHTAFAMESMIDELAHAAKQDPLAYRLALLERQAAPSPRRSQLAAEKAGWGTPPPAGRARGLAVHESFGSIVAEVAEVSVEDGRIRVHRVTAAVDCGTAVNPLGVEAQIQGSDRVRPDRRAVRQAHARGRPRSRRATSTTTRRCGCTRCRTSTVHIIASGAKMGGIGEPATAPIAPAVANAVFALTGSGCARCRFDARVRCSP